MTGIILTVGNSMMGDDAAGPLLAELLSKEPAPGWITIDGGSMPENHINEIREAAPERILIFDATDMGTETGAVHSVDPRDIAEMFFMTTHNMPLNFLIDRLKEFCPHVEFIGIQPSTIAFAYPMHETVKQQVSMVHGNLCAGIPLQDFAPYLTEKDLL